jgi:hypothetical protein
MAGASGSAAGLPGMPPGLPPGMPPGAAGATRSTAPSDGSGVTDGSASIAGALAPNPGGTILYYRIE